MFDHVVKPGDASARERFEALARSLRDLLAQRWLKTGDTYDRENPKQVYYLSMEFLIGRSTSNNLLNLLVEPFVREEMRRQGVDLDRLDEEEPDAGLGNGGLGRLAACFIDSMATLAIPAIGYGLRYEYGIFRQEIQGGRQVERPDNWLRRPDPWEVDRPAEAVDVRVQCAVQAHGEAPGPRRRPPDRPPGRPLRPAGRRLRRQDRQHAAALGCGGDGRLRLRRVQRRRLLRRRAREGRGREPDPRPLPGRLHPAGEGAAVRAGVLPRLLLAGRHRPAVPRPRQRLGARSPTRWRSSSTTPTPRWPSPS